jgi:hypothetical protein
MSDFYAGEVAAELDDPHQGGELAIGQRIDLFALPGRTNQVFEAVAPAIDLAAGYLYGAEILDYLHHRIQAIPRNGVHAPGVFSLFETSTSIIVAIVSVEGHD